MKGAASRPRSHGADADGVRGSRVDEGYDRVRDLIVDGRLAPGAPLTESMLADQLGMSRTPLHSALQRLEQEGYLTQLSPGSSRRLIVAPLTRSDADELVAILARIEGLAARWMAELPVHHRRAASVRLCSVNRALARSDRAPVFRQRDRMLHLDARFHRALVQAARRPRLQAFHQSIRPQWERYLRFYVATLAGDLDACVARHEEVAAAIEAGKAKAASSAIRADWRQAARRLAAVIDVVGERGTWR